MNKPLQTLAELAEAVGVDYSAINSDDMIIQTTEAALKEIKRLTTELSKETVRKEAAYANEQRLENDNLELRRRIFARFNEDECWIFQDDGHDYPESLVCPVVMSAGKLRELMAARSERDEMAVYRGQLVARGDQLSAEDTTPHNYEQEKTCTYPKCNCPFDAPDDNFLCARSLKREPRQ